MITSELNLSMATPTIQQAFAKEGDTGRVLKINLIDATPENGTLRIKRPDGVEVTSDAVVSEGEGLSGDSVSFEAYEEVDLTKCEVALEPYQDLSNGDPSPSNVCPIYPSNGKNLSPLATMTSTSGGSVNLSCGELGTVVQGQTYTLSLKNKTASTANLKIRIYDGVNQTDQTNQNLVANSNWTKSFTASTNGTVCLNSSLGSSYGSMEVFENIQLEKGNVATTFVPYQSINVYQDGENLVDATQIVNNSYYKDDGDIQTGSSTTKRYDGYIPILQPQLMFSYSTALTTVRLRVVEYDEDKTFLRTKLSEIYTGDVEVFLTTSADAKYIRFSLPLDATNMNVAQANTYPISLGRDVYGGTVDLATGKLTVDKGYAVFDGSSDESWSVGTNAVITMSDMKSGSNLDGISNMYVKGTSSGMIRFGNSNNKIYLVSISTAQGITTVAELQTFLSANNLQVVYPLATPLEYDLTPQQIQTLVGTNNMWSSGLIDVAFQYDSLFADIPSSATQVVGNCLADVNFTDISTLPFVFTVKENQA